MKQPSKLLNYLLTISLLVLLIPINTVSASTPTHIYEWMSQSGTISSDGLAHEYTNLEAGQTLDLSLILINRSNNTIQSRNRLGQSPGKQVPIGSYGIGSQTPYQDGTPYFLDTSSFVLNNNRFTYYEGNDVLPNEAISMSWTIKLANNLADGVYNLYVRPVSEYLAWTRQTKNGKLLPDNNSDIFWRLTVGEGELFVNNDFGFQVNIPAGYQYKEYSPPYYDREIYSAGFIISEEPPYPDNIYLNITSCVLDSSVDCLDWSTGTPPLSSPPFEKYLIIDGKKAAYYNEAKPEAGGTASYYIVSDGKGLKFRFRGNPGSKALDSIVESFEFL